MLMLYLARFVQVIGMVISVFLFIGMILYTPEDISFYYLPYSFEYEEYISYEYYINTIYSIFLQVLGYSAFFIPSFIFLNCFKKFTNQKVSFVIFDPYRLLAFIFLLISSAIFISILFDDIQFISNEYVEKNGENYSDFEYSMYHGGNVGFYLACSLLEFYFLKQIWILFFIISLILFLYSHSIDIKDLYNLTISIINFFKKEVSNLNIEKKRNLDYKTNVDKIVVLNTNKQNDVFFKKKDNILSDEGGKNLKNLEFNFNEERAVSDLYDDVSDFTMPSISLLKINKDSISNKIKYTEDELNQKAEELINVLNDFGVNGTITNISIGPVVTLYELEPAAGTKASRVICLADDIARSLSSVSTRISVISGKNAIGIELPNKSRDVVYLRDLLESGEYKRPDLKLPIVLGKNIAGAPVVADLAKMPHLLIAGTTGSGKSVGINVMVLSILYKYSPKECRIIMIDPKMLELSVYDDIPHLIMPVVTEPQKAVIALKWAIKEMEIRYRAMSMLGVRNIEAYNNAINSALLNQKSLSKNIQTGFDIKTGNPTFEDIKFENSNLPYIVIIVDEMADLMLTSGKEIEGHIQRLSQMARAAGIHLIMATQRPSVDVITGVIKANFPTRISFQVTSKIDSRTILGEMGAEQLLGKGDMLYMVPGGKIDRIHAPFVDDSEVEKVVKFLKSVSKPNYIDISEFCETESNSSNSNEDSYNDENNDADLYLESLRIIARDKKVSTSYLQRMLRIGYNRAAIIVEKMEKNGIVTQASATGKREIIINKLNEAIEKN